MQNEDLKYTISGNTILVYYNDLKIGYVKCKQNAKSFVCTCLVPTKLIQELINWHESCDYADDFLSFNLLEYPEEISYDPPSMDWTSHKDLESSIIDLYKCWKAMQ
ncbi:hypothetical protein ma35 [Moumouvirus australiensis]|uniref:Uncharacterized protein n=1 Tax=Moumouvirus australiensis TaxID=2109587 RepID=A0A2P1EKJ9_9VIRU|nr:hypothetical protein QKC55_gp868 [Moumouvirus australiensis]AVL94422.1 hypothetical protein ma35 [Moumouvirus australiensis]